MLNQKYMYTNIFIKPNLSILKYLLNPTFKPNTRVNNAMLNQKYRKEKDYTVVMDRAPSDEQVCVYVYVCMYVYVYVYKCICVYMYMCIYV
jgi:hypothetical protein